MSQRSLKRIVISSSLLIIVLIASLYVYSNLERYTTKETVNQSFQVKKNPYLAAEYYLKKLNQQVTTTDSINHINTLPTDKNSLLLLGNRDKFTPHQNEQILNWVKQGGSLIVEASQTDSTHKNTYKDALLNPLGIQLVEGKIPCKITQLYLEDEKEPIQLSLPCLLALKDLQDRAIVWAETTTGKKGLIQLPYGKGKITILSSATIWNNNNISYYDHAWLLGYLTAGKHVNIIYIYTPSAYTKEYPKFLLALIQNYPYSLFTGALLILLILWHNGVRTGPLEPVQERNRRQLPEQLTAQANFIYRQIGQQQLITLLQQDIVYRVKKRLANFEDLPRDQQHYYLSQLTEQPIRLVTQLMQPITSKNSFSKLAFTQTIIALQALRNAL